MKKMSKISLIILLFFGSFLTAEKLAELPQVVKPDSLVTDGKLLYIVEQKSAVIHMYKILDNNNTLGVEYIKDFGSRGEGPGEFKNAPTVLIFPEEVVIVSFGKIARFTREGILKEEEKVLIPVFKNHLVPMGKNYVSRDLIVIFGEKGKTDYVAIDFYDANLKKIRTIDKINYGNLAKEIVLTPHVITFRIHENKIFLANTNKGLFFEVLDSDCNLLYKVEKKYEKIKISSRFKKDLLAEAKKGMGPAWDVVKEKLKFPEYYPAMRDFHISDKKIYVRTYHRDFDRRTVKFIIMDLKGNNQRTLSLPYVDSLYTIKNSTYFYLSENEDKEMWKLHGIKIL